MADAACAASRSAALRAFSASFLAFASAFLAPFLEDVSAPSAGGAVVVASVGGGKSRWGLLWWVLPLREVIEVVVV